MVNAELILYHLKTYPDEVLQEFLREDTVKPGETGEENEIVILIMEELANRRKAKGEAPDVYAALARFREYYQQTDR